MAGVTCEKRRYGDEYHCGRCRTRWDVNDPEPPACEAEQSKPVTLTERLRVLHKALRALVPSLQSAGVHAAAGELDYHASSLEDMIEEVKLLDDERQRSKANVKGGSGANISPIRPRGA